MDISALKPSTFPLSFTWASEYEANSLMEKQYALHHLLQKNMKSKELKKEIPAREKALKEEDICGRGHTQGVEGLRWSCA
jgi:hypothetical protein